MDKTSRPDQSLGNVTRHAESRAWERLLQTGIDPMAVLRRAGQAAAAHADIDFAVLVVALPKHYGDTSGDLYSRSSNGDQVWCVCRGGIVMTMMLRRSDQPATAAAMRVQRVARFA